MSARCLKDSGRADNPLLRLGCTASIALILALMGTATHSAEIDAKTAASTLAVGKRILQKGKPDVAIHDYFDPVIQKYRDRYSKTGDAIYSAHTTTEMIVYSAMPVTANKEAASSSVTQGHIEVLDGAWVDALVLKGYALVELKEDDEAIEVLKEATALAPFNPTPWTELGYVYQTQRNWTAAMDSYKQAEGGAELLEDRKQSPKRPLYARALRGQGYVLTELGRLAEAEATYQQCLQINPDDDGAKHELAYIAQAKQKLGMPEPAQSDPTSK